MSHLSQSDVVRRLPSLGFIDDADLWEAVVEISADAPGYFWMVPASTSGYHHPFCRKERGLWLHTLMLSTVIDRLADSYVEQGRLSESEIDYAHAAAILHDQRKNGPPDSPSRTSTSDHDLQMASVVRNDDRVPDAVADAIAAHMGPWYDGPMPQTHLDDLVHNADMVASTQHITPAIPGPLPEELAHFDVEVLHP